MAQGNTVRGFPEPDATFSTSQGPDGEVVIAVFDIGDNFTSGLRKTGAQMDTVDTLEYAHDTYPNAAEVTVKGRFPTEDAYGHSQTSVVLDVKYSRETLNLINFDGVDSDKISAIRDSGVLHPDLK